VSSPGPRPLTPKQEAFARLYIELSNASEAYRRAYDASKMEPDTINRKAAELLKHGGITARLEELREAHAKRHEVTVDRLVAEAAKVAFANAGDYFEWGPGGVKLKPKESLTVEQQAAISEISQTVTKTETGGSMRLRLKLHPKLEAVSALLRFLVGDRMRHEVTGAGGAPLFDAGKLSDLEYGRKLMHLIGRMSEVTADRQAARPITARPPNAKPSVKAPAADVRPAVEPATGEETSSSPPPAKPEAPNPYEKFRK
jgi:hypothetical protein